MKTIAVHQPNYLPWLGYFYKISKVDLFVIQNDVDFESGNAESVTNRTRIKTPDGITRITVPVKHKKESKLISDIQIDNTQQWSIKHLRLIKNAYRNAPWFNLYYPALSGILTNPESKLADLNISLIIQCCQWLEIKTPFVLSSEIGNSGLRKSARLTNICNSLEANCYLSGNGAKKYNDPQLFENNRITLTYSKFTALPYTQLWSDFMPGLSVIDALFNLGPNTKDLLKDEESTNPGL